MDYWAGSLKYSVLFCRKSFLKANAGISQAVLQSISLLHCYRFLISTHQVLFRYLLVWNDKGFSTWCVNLECDLASNAVGISWPLATGTGRRSWEAAYVSSCVIRRVLSRDVHVLKGGKKWRRKVTLLWIASQKQDNELIFSWVAYERFSLSPRQFVSLKTKKTINNAG